MTDAAFLSCMVAFWAGWTIRHRLQKRIDRDGFRTIGEKLQRSAESTLKTKKFVGDGFVVVNESRLTLPDGKCFLITLREDFTP